MRILVAGILGAVAMFVWMSIAHMATPLATAGISKMTNEQVVLDAMKKGIGTGHGLYLFPWVDPKDPKMMDTAARRMKAEPNGILVYHPPGGSADMTPMLVREFIKEALQSILAAFLVSLTILTGYFSRVGFVALIGVFSALGTNASYAIWYGFPHAYTHAQMIIEIVGAIAAGLVIAAIVKPRLSANGLGGGS